MIVIYLVHIGHFPDFIIINGFVEKIVLILFILIVKLVNIVIQYHL